MRQQRLLYLSTLVVLASLLLPASSQAQAGFRYAIGFMGGFGGATASEPSSSTVEQVFVRDDSFDLGFQLVFDMEVRRGTLFGLRVGQMDIELSSPLLLSIFDGPIESELTYASAVGEYRLSTGLYQSGLFLGLGYYSIDGQSFFDDDTGLGLTVGTTGDFRINDRWSVLVEFSGHYADLDYAQFFVMGHAGVAFRF